MRHFFTLLRNEIWKLLINPSAYIAAFLFLLIMGFFFQAILDEYAASPQDESPSITFFRLSFLPVFFMVPLLTMRSIAEERFSGTIETLMTTPVTATEIILSKYTAAYLYYMALWAFTGSFHALFFYFSKGEAIFEPYPIIGGYVYIALSGTLFLALGIFASSLTHSQLIAAIVSFSLVFGFIVLGSYSSELSKLWASPPWWVDPIVDHTNVLEHMKTFASGVLDFRAFALYLSCAATFLFLSILNVEYRDGAR